MERRLFVWLLVASLLAGCVGQQNPTPTPSPTPINNPPIADFSYSWIGGDKEQPWTCSKITFKADVSGPERDRISLMWHDNNNALFQFMDKSSFETKLWPDGIHTIKLTATDDKGAKTVVEKQINVKYEVPEPVPVKTKDGVNIATSFMPAGVEISTHSINDWSFSPYTPLLGFYDLTNPIIWDWHIKWALEHGISNFMIWMAPHGRPPEELWESSDMKYYRDGFLKAKYKDRIGVYIIYDMSDTTNPYHPRFIPPGDDVVKDTEILCKHFFNQSNYRFFGKRPILFLGAINQYLCDNCEDKKDREELLKSHIKSIRETSKKYGYDVFLVGDISESFHKDTIDEFIIEHCDATTSFNLALARNPDKYKWTTDEKGKEILIAPYDDMVDASIKRENELSELAKNKGKFYIPFVEQGFDTEKRFNSGYLNWMIKRTGPSPKKFEEYLKGVRSLIEPKQGILLTTWNEFCEGNVIEPTKEFGFGYLDKIRDNFAIKPAEGWPPNIVPTKNCGCTEYKNWNEEIGMPGTPSSLEGMAISFLEILFDERRIWLVLRNVSLISSIL